MKKSIKWLVLGAVFSLLAGQVIAQNCYSNQGCQDYSNFGIYSSSAGTLEYDNFISSFHSTFVREIDGSLKIWGQNSKYDGSGDWLVPTVISRANYNNLFTGTPLKAALGSSKLSIQHIMLTNDNKLWAWGTKGAVISNSLTTSNQIQSFSLPSGINASDVKMLFGTYHTLALVTCGGSVYVMSQVSANRGTGTGSSNSNNWYQVRTSSTAFLSGIVAVRGCPDGLIAIDNSGNLWTWGTLTYNNSSAAASRSYATALPKPSTSGTVKMVGATSNGSVATYYVLFEDGNLWAIGDNTRRQLGNWSTTSSNTWVQPRYTSSSGPVMNNILWISPQEHDDIFTSINVIKNDNTLWNWGEESGYDLGRGTQADGQSGNPLNPGQASQWASGYSNQNIQAVETGGHTTMVSQRCQKKFGYVGHRIDGSMGDGQTNSQFESLITFNTAAVEICGAPSGLVEINLLPDGAAVTIGVPLQLTYAPTGGNFSITSGNATVTSTGVLTPTGPGAIVVRYTVAGACEPNYKEVTIAADRVKIDANDDFNAGLVNKPIPGNVKQNDGGVNNPKYGTSPSLKGSPTGSNPQITMNNDGSYSFVTDKPGIYTYDVTVCADGGTTNCLTTQLVITVTNPGESTSNPGANKPHADLDLGTTKVNTPITLDIRQNDGPGNYGKTLDKPTITGGPKNGTAEIDPSTGELIYTPNPGFTGKDTVYYQVCEVAPPTGNCATAMAIITVVPETVSAAGGPHNTTSATDDYAWTPRNTAVSGNVKTNDVDIEGNTTTVTTTGTTTIAGVGTLVLNSNGSYTFTPDPNFTGTVDFPYTICDNGTPQACDNASLHIVVYDVNERLAVNFGNIIAKWVNGQLIVNWSTMTESDNSLFEVEISKDGVNFTKIGEVNSKATEGNSNQAISYDFAKSANDLGAAGLAILGLAIGAGLIRRRKLMLSLAVISVLLIGYSCNKNNNDVINSDKENAYVRIVQVNKDGSKTYSKVVRVVNE